MSWHVVLSAVEYMRVAAAPCSPSPLFSEPCCLFPEPCSLVFPLDKPTQTDIIPLNSLHCIMLQYKLIRPERYARSRVTYVTVE